MVTIHDHARRILGSLGLRFLPHYIISRHVLTRARTLTAVSPYIARYVSRVSRTEVPVIANCLSSQLPGEMAPALKKDPESPVIVAAWSWARYRNSKRGLAAFARFRREFPAARLLLMGVGFAPGGDAEKWARENRLVEGVEFLGLPTWSDVLRMLAGADAVFHPSLEDSFALPVAEAMLRGIPVVASQQAPGPAWLLGQGEFGTLADGEDVAAIAASLVASVKDRNERQLAAASAHIRQLCDPDAILAAYDEIYERSCK